MGRKPDLDLGDDHYFWFTQWSPDRSIPENAERYKDIADVNPFGGIYAHKDPADESWCWGGVHFESPAAVLFGGAMWKLISKEPLHMEPSLLCMACRDHGWIRNGKWVRT